jgi:hypothetical protein
MTAFGERARVRGSEMAGMRTGGEIGGDSSNLVETSRPIRGFPLPLTLTLSPKTAMEMGRFFPGRGNGF